MPISNSEVSEEQCIEIVNKDVKFPFKIKQFAQIPFAEVNGYLGEHSTLQIQIESNGTAKTLKYFVKALPKVTSQLAFLNEINGFYKETQFFNKIVPILKENKITTLDDAIPKSYIANSQIIILEDLKSQGYQTMNSRESLTLDCVEVALVSLAKLHASGLILQEMQKKKLNESFAKEMQEGFYGETELITKVYNSCKHGMRAMIDLNQQSTSKLSQEKFAELALEGINLQKKFTTPGNQFKNTICHGDPWTKNVMFKFKNGKASHCIVVDFQTYRYGPPAQDVMAFIYLVTDRELRNEKLNYLLDFYYKHLKQFLDENKLFNYISKSEFEESCKYFKQFALTQVVTHFQMVILSDEIIKELFADQTRTEYVILENKYDFIVYACGKDPIYRKKVYGAINELREFYERKTINS